jgi:maleylacetoacetate isomerase
MLRLYRIPFSTNVERVALALAHKGLEVESVWIDPNDRSEVERVSGQPLVPVLEEDGLIVADSPVILRYIDERYPQQPLYPTEPARRAELDVFVEWFNRVWKLPPNAIADELSLPEPDLDRIEALGAQLISWLDLFEALLAGRDHLFGEFSAADCVAFPFLKYALLWDEGDDELFHEVLRDWQPLGDSHPRLEAWIRRVDERPRV